MNKTSGSTRQYPLAIRTLVRSIGRRKLERGAGVARQLFLWQEQRGECAICKCTIQFQTAHLDHDHETGQVRGFLCSPCNKGLGFFDDSSPRLAAAIAYLAPTTATSSRPAQ